MPKIALKTGTSLSKRRLSIIIMPNIPLFCKFQGEGVPELWEPIHTPLFVPRYFQYNDYNFQNGLNHPKIWRMRKVSAESGDVPNEFCINQITIIIFQVFLKMTLYTR
jgi:hypothetical protein